MIKAVSKIPFVKMPADLWFHVVNADEIASPALLVWPDRVARNIESMLNQVGGDPARLRPHVKTHKLAEVVRMQRDAGIEKFKCATIAEAEMTAGAGARDVLFAYQPVGPNIGRLRSLVSQFPETRFSALVDDEGILSQISAAFTTSARPARLFLDLDCGMGRSGILPGESAMRLCRRMEELPGVEFGGIHVYDGHIHDVSVKDRDQHFATAFGSADLFLRELERAGIRAPVIVGGGSPTFPWHAMASTQLGDRYECSPGTTLFWDAGYGTRHPDLDFVPAAALLARIISRPGSGRLCLDLGHKAVAAENPLENRVRFPEIPEAKLVLQSEEHLVLETPNADRYSVGDIVYGIPWHICPTVALHQEAVIVRDGRATGERWEIRARNRRLSV